MLQMYACVHVCVSVYISVCMCTKGLGSWVEEHHLEGLEACDSGSFRER